MFGELAMFGGETRSATAEALEDTTAVALLGGDMQRLLARNPDIAVKMLDALADRCARTNERLSSSPSRRSPGRVASALLGAVDRAPGRGRAASATS